MNVVTREPTPAGEAFEFPVSFAQQRLWFLDRLEQGSSAYNVPLVLHLEGTLHAAALERALTALIERHEALRTTFAEFEGEPVQIVRPAVAQTIEQIDLRGSADPQSAALELALERSTGRSTSPRGRCCGSA